MVVINRKVVVKDIKIESSSSRSKWTDYKGLTFDEFWNTIGKPEKNGIGTNVFPYELDLIKLAETEKHIWIKKATGLGITEFWLRWISWMSTRTDEWNDKKVVIVTGPNQDLAIGLISRIKAYFPHLDREKEKRVTLNGCIIEAYPSNHIEAMRSLTNVIFILLDEADFFHPGEQKEVRHAAERYIAKGDPWIVMVSTPNNPDGLFDRMEHEEPCLYKRIFLDYRVGLYNIYTAEEIAKARLSPSFEREYNLKYGYGLGNVFKPEDIDEAIKEYDLNGYRFAQCREGIDPTYGSGDGSAWAFVIAAKVDGKIRLYMAEEFKGLGFHDAEAKQADINRKYHPEPIRIDGSNPAYVKAVKGMMNERIDYEKEDNDAEKSWLVKPVSFGIDSKAMLTNMQNLVSDKQIEIHPSFTRLISQMRSAVSNEKGMLDKTAMHLDLIDAFRLCVFGYHYGKAQTKE